MARRQSHLLDQCRVPRRDDQPARIGVALDHRDQLGDLVDRLAVGRRPVAPLVAVHRAEVAVGVGPLVPDAHAVVLQVLDVGVALEEPQQLVDDRFQVALLGGDQREAGGQVEAHLVAEHAVGAGAGAVGLEGAGLAHQAHQVEVLFHRGLGGTERGGMVRVDPPLLKGQRSGRGFRLRAPGAGRRRPSAPGRRGSSAG
ncbi:hypothetical protein D3C84_193210 [compost metagenome]